MSKEKNRSKQKFNLLWAGIGFSVFYWMLEAVRDVIILGKGNILRQIFIPDPMIFWMRMLVVCIFVLFSVKAQSLKKRMMDSQSRQSGFSRLTGVVQIGFGFGMLYWFLESVRDSFIYNRGSIFERMFALDSMGLWIRLLAVFILILFSLYAQSLINAQNKVEEKLRKEQEELEKQVKERTEELLRFNNLLKRENAERKRIEAKLIKTNRALRTLSESNKTLVRTTEEKDLLNNICDVIVNYGEYPFTWVGFSEQDEEKSVQIVSKSGCDEGYLDDVKFTWQEQDRSIVSNAIRTCKPCMMNNGFSEYDDIPWKSEAIKRGFVSSISFPLMNNSSAFGVLNIYSKDTDAFNVEEVELLKEMTDDLAFGIIVQRERIVHKQLEGEKRNIQSQLLQAQKMEAVGIMAGGMAHDFNNVLTVIRCTADNAMMNIDKSDFIYKDFEHIGELTENASGIISQILLFSRKHPMKFVTIDFNKIIESIDRMFLHTIQKDIQIEIDLAPDLWKFNGDQCTLKQVLMNLIVNTKDAMKHGGQLSVKTENILINKEQCRIIPEARIGRYVCFSVSDTGIGMECDTIQHIFEPFFTTKGSDKGTGLGLSVVYGIIKQHEGWINVESKPGHGSDFKIYLPAIYTA
jgi:signal transduction histidine kinase